MAYIKETSDKKHVVKITRQTLLEINKAMDGIDVDAWEKIYIESPYSNISFEISLEESESLGFKRSMISSGGATLAKMNKKGNK